MLLGPRDPGIQKSLRPKESVVVVVSGQQGLRSSQCFPGRALSALR